MKVGSATINPQLALQPGQARRDTWRTYVLVILFALFLTGLIAPYRSVHLPMGLMLTLGVVFILICIKFSVEEYERLMLLFCVFAPFQKVLPGDFGGLIQGFNITNIFAFFLLLGWAIQTIRREKRFYVRRSIDVPVLIFCFLGIISLFRRELYTGEQSVLDSVFFMKEWLLPMIIYLIVVNNIKDRRTLVRLVVVICITTSIIGFLALKRYYVDKGGFYNTFSSYDKARIGVISGQPNQFGAFMSYYTFLLAAFLLYNWRNPRYWALILPIAACARSMLLTFSRGSQVAFFAGLAVTVFLWSRKVFFFAFVPLVLFLALCPQFVPGVFVGRMRNTIQKDGTLDYSTQNRIEVWKTAVRMIQAHPLVGVGYGNFQWYVQDFGLPRHVHGIDAHNSYLLYAAEMGIPAAACFILILLICWRKGYLVWRWSRDPFFKAVAVGFLGGLTGLMVSNLFGSRLNSNEIVFQFWILIAVIMKMAHTTKLDHAARTELALERHRRELQRKIRGVAPGKT
ncbi:MAG: hypothetical protein DRP79_06045 [Planctomycetota bacterium]|nr:MAG: hypothetical protein DRP79_06045 [Planctomycetota bacterium]